MRDTVKIPKNLSEPEWGALGQIVFQRSYARPTPDGTKETWAETVKRVVDGNVSMVSSDYIEPYEAQRLFHLIYNMKFMPAGRHLWACGIESGSQFVSNCFTGPYDPGDFSRHFGWTFLRLMEGGGVGSNYSNRFVRQYRKVPHEVDLHLVCKPDHDDYDQLDPLLSDRFSWKWDGTFDVPDSREGWAEALVRLLDCYYNHQERIVVDLSHIRPSGSPLKTFGGTASGPHALARMLTDISGEMNDYKGRKPDTELFLDLDHAIAKAVLAGGTRRSARMACKHWKDSDIMDFVTAKRDGGHHTANFSIITDKDYWTAYRDGHERAVELMHTSSEGIKINGEPGWLNATKHEEGELGSFFSTNPCFTGDTKILVADGRRAVPLEQLADEDKDVPVWSYNPSTGQQEVKRGWHPRLTGKKPIYEVTFRKSGSIRVTGNHKFLVNGGNVKTTRQLHTGDTVPQFRKNGHSLEVDTRGLHDVEVDEAGRVKKECEDCGQPFWVSPDQRELSYCSTCCQEFGRYERYPSAEQVKSRDTSWYSDEICQVRLTEDVEKVYNITVPDNHTVMVVGREKRSTNNHILSGVCTPQCGEIGFPIDSHGQIQGVGACNLSSVNLSALSGDIPKLKETLRLGARFLMRATWADFPDPDLRDVISSERRIGLGLMGFHPFLMDHDCKYTEFPHDDRMKDMFRDFYDIVREEARDYAFHLRVPEPVKVTTVAPTGTSSKLPGTTPGMQPMEHTYFLRRMMFAAHDEEKMERVRQLEATGFNVEDSVHEDNTKVVEFPLAAPALEDVNHELVETAKDISIEQMLEVQAALQDTWADNAISVTVNFDPETSRERIERAIAAYGPRVKGLTMMPWVSDVEQAPLEKISEDEFFSYPDHLRQSADAAAPCATGACEFDPDHIQGEE